VVCFVDAKAFLRTTAARYAVSAAAVSAAAVSAAAVSAAGLGAILIRRHCLHVLLALTRTCCCVAQVPNGRLGLHEKIMGMCSSQAGGIARVCAFTPSGWQVQYTSR